jgi:uncharacterized membrane protein YccC
MDASEILVAIMITAAVAWLVWAELHSRRNRRASQKTVESAGPKALDKPETQAGSRQARA